MSVTCQLRFGVYGLGSRAEEAYLCNQMGHTCQLQRSTAHVSYISVTSQQREQREALHGSYMLATYQQPEELLGVVDNVKGGQYQAMSGEYKVVENLGGVYKALLVENVKP